MTSFLEQYKRQPKIYVDLPMSNFYPEGVLRDNQSVSLPVYGMTASDEIMLKTPDALFNGEATKNVIQSCIPNILDAGKVPTMDIDFCLIAIRLATYGESMPLSVKCPSCGESSEYNLDLQSYLEKFQNREFQSSVNVDGLKFHFAPIDYNQMTDFNIKNYQLQKSLVNLPEEWTDEQKEKHNKKIIQQVAQLNLELMLAYLRYIESEEDKEADAETINNFIANSDVKFYNAIKNHIDSIKKVFDSPTEEVICASCEHKFETKMPMDYSSFFGLRL
jgi:ribosomal protein S27E